MLNSLATTVATPAKCVGRDAPSIVRASAATDTTVIGRLGVHLATRQA